MVKPYKNRSATENLIRREINFLRNEIEDQFEDLEKRGEKRHDIVMGHLDKLAGEFKKFGQELTFISHRLVVHEDRVENLEKTVLKSS
ncbi:hypothetical protein HY045_01470 [Candidatus Woesebacteria bacterium]|nr:hypothetical protein [Candidatus Woesebacteria bacterium]